MKITKKKGSFSITVSLNNLELLDKVSTVRALDSILQPNPIKRTMFNFLKATRDMAEEKMDEIKAKLDMCVKLGVDGSYTFERKYTMFELNEAQKGAIYPYKYEYLTDEKRDDCFKFYDEWKEKECKLQLKLDDGERIIKVKEGEIKRDSQLQDYLFSEECNLSAMHIDFLTDLIVRIK